MSEWFTSLPLGWQNLLSILVAFVLAWFVQRISLRISTRLINLNQFSSERTRLRPERVRTLHGLVAGMIGFVAFLLAILFTFSLFVNTDTLIWMVGLFSAAFGLGRDRS
ncbi:MAG: hypothetical protein IPL78_09675 [Chloroflexi bacterium]|nr:hypothetical protein [Chloroflexota bacterium]